jgi:2-deoxy-D-gluconate 3-dehydrogenase
MILDQFKLEGKTALVTGCASGIGQGIANAMAEAGANIVGMGLPTNGDDTTKTQVEALGRSFRYYDTDFSDRTSLYAAIKQIKADFGTPDILVNNAGTIMRAPIHEHSDEFWDKVIEINLSAQFIITREFGREMMERGAGKIIFTCSLLTFQGGITVPGYAASKSGVARLVMAFANEWAGKGVNINGIAPGYIATANTKALREDPERSAAILARIPAGRWGTPADFGGPAVFLASDAALYMNGHVMVVDGGWMGR